MNPSLFNIVLAVVCLVGTSACQPDNRTAAAPDAGKIIFTELMPNHNAGGPDWIELFNTGTSTVNLQHCTVSNNAGETLLIAESLAVPASKYVVLASSVSSDQALPSALMQAGLVYKAEEFQLRVGGSVSLHCGDRQIDQVDYSTNEPTSKGIVQSQQRHFYADGGGYKARNTWCYTNPLEEYQYAAVRFATPSKPNSFCSSEMPYLSYDDQESVRVDGIDLSATLRVAEAELARKMATSELVLWGIRDQRITPVIARKVSELYFANIDMLYDTEPFTVIDWNHAVWHFAWAISNMYRNGDQKVKAELQLAYEDALTRPETLDRFKYVAIEYIRGERVVMGDAHTPAHKLMQKLIVAPGNPDYIHSYEEYVEKRRSAFATKAMHYAFVTANFFSNLFQ